MNDEVILKVFLQAYKDLETKCKVVEIQSLRVAFASRNKDVYECVETIIALNNQKITYCNVKVLIDDAISHIGRISEIKAYYLDAEDYKDIIKRINITERQLFGRIKRQRIEMLRYIKTQYDTEFLTGLISGSRWLMSLYNKEIKKAEKERQKHL